MDKIIYREADLDYIFIRAQLSDGRWGNLSLNEVSDKQFLEWLTDRLGPLDQFEDIIPPETSWTPTKKVELLNALQDKVGFVVSMIKREARNEWDKNS